MPLEWGSSLWGLGRRVWRVRGLQRPEDDGEGEDDAHAVQEGPAEGPGLSEERPVVRQDSSQIDATERKKTELLIKMLIWKVLSKLTSIRLPSITFLGPCELTGSFSVLHFFS